MVRFFFRIYQFCIAFPLLLVATIITALVTMVGSILFGGKWWGYWPPHVWSKLFCWLSFVRVKVVGRENISSGESYVFIANHQSAYDIFTIYGYLNHNFKWMMKESLEKIPLVGAACKYAGHIMVDRTNPQGIRRTLEDARAKLKDGMSIVVFPEGSRTKTGYMAPFKKGAFLLASQFGLPMVPITIDGSYDVINNNVKLPLYGVITLTIHPPVQQEGNLSQLMQKTHNIINSSLTKYQQLPNNEEI